ncbi:nose resistant to fluoxetine protein 6-like [Uloborus diversus]|uniref:nose resistant to fluoxetine protein 6-like n=1 Tax=Uloborus diversus TaxID=327109 RepID=UPI002409845F|nr:nose resistant to fluoxetine protein 6-like [Uloborus diversus]
MNQSTIIILVCFATSSLAVRAKKKTTPPPDSKDLNKEENKTILQEWQTLEKAVKDDVKRATRTLMQQMMLNLAAVNVSEQCMFQGMQLLNAEEGIETWAMKFIDSSAKIVNGMLLGSMSSFGDYDECLNIGAKSKTPEDKAPFRGQYCMVNLSPPLPPKPDVITLYKVLDELKDFTKGGTAVSEIAKVAHSFYFFNLQLGVCVPSGCSVDDIDSLAKMAVKKYSLKATVSRCEMKEENSFSISTILVISFFSLLGLLMVIGSLIDTYAFYTKTTCSNAAVRILLTFSLMTNFRKFINTKSDAQHLSCLHGIRFFCCAWIVLANTYFITITTQAFLNLEKLRECCKDFAFQAILNASYAPDTFFCIGGLLVSYVIVKRAKDGGQPFNIVLHIFHRLIRLVPVYASVIVVVIFLVYCLGSGPIWHSSVDRYIDDCNHNWWMNLAFINNFYEAERMCLPQTWYLAVDFQLYTAALLVLLPFLRWPKLGIFLCVLGISASIVYSGLLTFMKNLPPTLLAAFPEEEQRNKYWAEIFFSPIVHGGPYCVGLLTGYFIAAKPSLKIPTAIQLLGWCIAFFLNFSVLYGITNWNKGVEPLLWSRVLYAGFSRVAWALGVAWIILCCVTGHGGIINYILTWKAFVPLSRLTFIVFLIHPIVQIIIVGNLRTQIQLDHFVQVWLFFGHLCVSFGVAFAVNMVIEAPALALEKIVLSRFYKRTKDVSPVPDKSVSNEKIAPEMEEDIANRPSTVVYDESLKAYKNNFICTL